MSSLADIPDAFLSPELKPQFIEWLKLLPAPKTEKIHLIAQWARFTNTTYNADDITAITTTGLLTDVRQE